MTVLSGLMQAFAFGPDISGAKQFRQNMLSMSSAQIAIRISRLLTTIVIARNLAPADYGLAAVVLTTYEFVAFFTRNGISAKVVQASEASVHELAETANTMTWIICATLALLQAASALLIAVIWQNASLGIAIMLMGLVYFATPLSNIQGAFLQREGRLGRIAATGAIQVIADNIITTILVCLDYGMWAIVLPKIIVAPIWVIGLRYGHAWRQTRWQLVGWRRIARFSRSVLGIEFLTTAQTNVDNLIVGHLLGLEALGYYYFAYNAGLGLTLGLVNACGIAVYPHLCFVREDPVALRRRYRESLKGLGRLLVPLIACQAALAPLYVPVVFGDHWRPAIPVLILVCLSALARPFAIVTSQLLKATNRPDIELRWQLAITPILVVGLLFGSLFGLVGVAAALCVVQAGMLAAYAAFAPRNVLHRECAAVDDPQIHIQVVCDHPALLALQADWRELFARAHEPSLTQSFAWCLTGWQTTCAPRGRKLKIVVVRRCGRAILIWPLVTRRKWLWTVATPLGAESSEYAPIIVDKQENAEALIDLAWTSIRNDGRIHLVKTPLVRKGGGLFAHFLSLRHWRAVDELDAPFVRLQSKNWQQYLKSRSSNVRTGLGRRRRRMSEAGAVDSYWVTDVDEFDALLEWALTQKMAWLAKRGLANDFLDQSMYTLFLRETFRSPSSEGRLAMMALKVAGQTVAVKVVCIDSNRVEGFITTYHEAWAQFSPGQILLADCLQWCAEHGRDYDFRIGGESYKAHWATDNDTACSFDAPCNLGGHILVAIEAAVVTYRGLRAQIALAIPEPWRKAIRAFPTPGRTQFESRRS